MPGCHFWLVRDSKIYGGLGVNQLQKQPPVHRGLLILRTFFEIEQTIDKFLFIKYKKIFHFFAHPNKFHGYF